ncbi:MAG: hypothetical protein ACFFBC_00480 [Promethearchaeota archaeon]
MKKHQKIRSILICAIVLCSNQLVIAVDPNSAFFKVETENDKSEVIDPLLSGSNQWPSPEIIQTEVTWQSSFDVEDFFEKTSIADLIYAGYGAVIEICELTITYLAVPTVIPISSPHSFNLVDTLKPIYVVPGQEIEVECHLYVRVFIIYSSPFGGGYWYHKNYHMTNTLILNITADNHISALDPDYSCLNSALSSYPISEVSSFEINKTEASTNEMYDINFTVSNLNTYTLSEPYNATYELEKSTDGYTWHIFRTGNVTLSTGTSHSFFYTDFSSTILSNQRVYYRVKLSHDHLKYITNYQVIQINPSKPYISNLKIYIEQEILDPGWINPTELCRINGTVHNPTGLQVNAIHIMYTRYFTDDPEYMLVVENIGDIPANSNKKFSLGVSNITDLTYRDTPYLIPGYDRYLSNGSRIQLHEWDWCDKESGEVYSTERDLEFQVWIQDDETDSKITQQFLVHIPHLKISYADFIQESNQLAEYYRNQADNMNDLGKWANWAALILDIGALLVDIFADVYDLLDDFLNGLSILLDSIGIYWDYEEDRYNDLEDGEEARIRALIQSIIEDPPDPNIEEVVEIEEIYIDPLPNNVSESQTLRNLHAVYEAQNLFITATEAIKISIERYTYAMMVGNYNAAKIQAEAVKNYTLIQSNFYHSYITHLEDYMDNLTPEIIINNEGIDFDGIVQEISTIQIDIINNVTLYEQFKGVLIKNNYTERDAEEIIDTFLDFSLLSFNQQVEQFINDSNEESRVVVSNNAEVMEMIVMSSEQLVRTAENPSEVTVFEISSSQYSNLIELSLQPSICELFNGENATISLTITNLIEEPVMTHISLDESEDIQFLIENIDLVSQGIDIELDPIEIKEIPIEIRIPVNSPPKYINPEITVSTEKYDKIYRKTKRLTIIIEDDDLTPPQIFLDHEGESTDGQPGTLEFKIRDPDENSEATGELIIEDQEGILFSETYAEGTFIIDVNQVPIFELGEYSAILSVENNDDDGWDGDEETNSFSILFNIEDDDKDPPNLSDLIITLDIHHIYLTLNASDYSGIDTFTFIVNGQVIKPLYSSQNGDIYYFVLLNQWILNKGIHNVQIKAIDGDNDRPNDNLINSISGNFEISLGNMYEYVDWQIEELKAYVDEIFSCRKSRCLNRKLSKAQEHLVEAFSSVENGEITCTLYNDKMAKVFVQIVEFRNELYNRHFHNKYCNNKCCHMSDEHTEYIIDTLHAIRNNIVILMGASTGSEQAYDIAYLEVDLLNLSDFIEEEISSCTGKYLSWKVYCASKMLESALFKIDMEEDSEYILNCVQWKLERVIWKINWYLNKERISENLADYLTKETTRIMEVIEQLIVG